MRVSIEIDCLSCEAYGYDKECSECGGAGYHLFSPTQQLPIRFYQRPGSRKLPPETLAANPAKLVTLESWSDIIPLK